MKLQKFITNPIIRFSYLNEIGLFRSWNDAKFLQHKFKLVFGCKLNLDSPKTFNEKLQWLKLYDRKPVYTTMVDKFAVKKYVADRIGEEYIIPTLGVWNSFDDINFDNLPNQFVLKCTHDSGGLVICKDKDSFDKKEAKRKIQKCLKRNYYWSGREWPYKDVPRKIIAEKYMEDKETGELRDYKFFCFNGIVDCVMLCCDRSSGDTKFYFFDRDWNLLRYNIRGKSAPEDFTLKKPKNIDEMFDLVAKLSVGIPFVRIDLYNLNDQIYFGEFTFYPDSGFDNNLLKETDQYFGSLITLGETKCIQ